LLALVKKTPIKIRIGFCFLGANCKWCGLSPVMGGFLYALVQKAPSDRIGSRCEQTIRTPAAKVNRPAKKRPLLLGQSCRVADAAGTKNRENHTMAVGPKKFCIFEDVKITSSDEGKW
jgi:hypothetical protein